MRSPRRSRQYQLSIEGHTLFGSDGRPQPSFQARASRAGDDTPASIAGAQWTDQAEDSRGGIVSEAPAREGVVSKW